MMIVSKGIVYIRSSNTLFLSHGMYDNSHIRIEPSFERMCYSFELWKDSIVKETVATIIMIV